MRQRCSDIARYPAVDRAARATRDVLRGYRCWRLAPGGLDTESLSFEIEPFSRQTEHGSCFFDPSTTLLERVLHHCLLDMADGSRHWLIEADDDFSRIEHSFRRRDRATGRGDFRR